MNKQQFMKELNKRLKGLSEEDRKDALSYYEEFFEDSGVGEKDDVTNLTGKPEDVARKIIGESVDKQDKVMNDEGGIKNSMKAVWLVILGICAAPIAFPLLIVAVVLVFVFFVVMFSLGISFAAVAISMIAMGILLLIGMIWTSGAQLLVLLGMALICIGGGLLFFFLVSAVFKACGRLSLKLFRKITGKNRRVAE